MSFDWFLSIYIYTLFWCFFLFFFSFRSLGRKQHRWQWALCLFHSPDDNNVISYFFFFVCLFVWLFFFFFFSCLSLSSLIAVQHNVCVLKRKKKERGKVEDVNHAGSGGLHVLAISLSPINKLFEESTHSTTLFFFCCCCCCCCFYSFFFVVFFFFSG